MHSLQPILNLLDSVDSVATRMVLDREVKREEHGFEWVMFRPFSPWQDASPLTVARKGRDMHVYRDGVDILRRTRDGLWEFGPGNTIPVFYQSPRISVLGLTRYFLESPTWLSELGNFDADTVTEGEIAGRDTLIIPLGDVVLSIDAEHGTILSAENSTERVFVTDIEFLDDWEPPEWTGVVAPSEEQAPQEEEQPEFEPVVLPPAPVGGRNLRVLCTWHDMEGATPAWQPGDHVAFFLSFNLGEAPLEGLGTTRRGHLEPGELYTDYRSYGFHADGWNALLATEKPLHREEELTGYFTHSTYSTFDIPTHVVITAVYHNGPDTIIDATLDGAIPPPLKAPINDGGSSTSDGKTFWVTDTGLPHILGFSVDSGMLTHEISIPCWENVRLRDGNIASTPNRKWILPALKEVEDYQPATPEGWKIHQSFDDNLHSLIEVTTENTGIYPRQALLQTDPHQLVELDLGALLINEVFRYGERIYARTYHHFITFTTDLKIIGVETQGRQEALYTPLGDLPPGTTPSHGTRIDSLIRFHLGENVYAFHDPQTTEQITTFRKPLGKRSEIVHATANKIVVAVYDRATRRVDSLKVWEPARGWQTRVLDR